jgi:hypothetical protein
MVLIQTGWVIMSPSMKNTNSACVFADAVMHVTAAGKWVAGMGTNLIVIFYHKCPLDGLSVLVKFIQANKSVHSCAILL